MEDHPRRLKPKNNSARVSVQRIPLGRSVSSNSVSLDIHGTSETLAFSDRVAYWATKLAERSFSGRPKITLDQSQKILAAFAKTQTAASLAELSEFVDTEFVAALDHVVYYYARNQGNDEQEIAAVLVQIYVHILRHELSCSSVVATGSVPAIYFSLVYADKKEVSLAVIRVLNSLCSQGFEKRQFIFTTAGAFHRHSAERRTFQTLVDLFRYSEDEDIIGEVASFFAGFSSTDKANFVTVAGFQRALLDLDIHEAFKAVLDRLRQNSSSNACIRKVEQAYSAFANNVIQTHKACLVERTEGKEKDIDVSNVEDLWSFILGNAERVGYESSLLGVLSALIYVPADEALARSMLTMVIQVINELTCETETETGGTRKKEFNPLDSTAMVSMATDRLQRTKQVQAASDEDEFKKLKKEVKLLREENEQLKKDLKEGGGRGVSGGGGQISKAGPKQSSGPQPSGSNSPGVQASSRQGEASQSSGSGGGAATGTTPTQAPAITRPKVPKGQLDSTGLQPAGPLAGATPQAIPPCPEPGQPGSLEQAPVKVLAAGEKALTPEEKARRKRKEKEEKLKAQLLKEAQMLQELGMSELKPLNLSSKLKSLHWKKLAVSELKGTVWVNLDQTGVKLDTKAIEERYANARKSRGTAIKKTDVKPQAMNIDQGRMILARSINQTLNKLNSGYSITELVQNIHPVLFELPNLLMMLVGLTPTAEQLEQVQLYNSNPLKYQSIEGEDKLLFKEVCEIDRYGDRVDLLKITSRSFFASAEQIEANINLLVSAFEELMKSATMKIILEFILAFGNVLNYGTSHGGAYGVDLSSLVALNSHKDNDGQPTLRFLAGSIAKRHPEVSSAMFPKCEESLNSPTVSEILTSIKQLASVKGRVAKKKLGFQNDASDVFFNYLVDFEQRAAEPVKKLKAMGKALKQKYKAILAFYPASPADTKQIESRQLITIFLDLHKAFKAEFERAAVLDAAIQRAKTNRVSKGKNKDSQPKQHNKKYLKQSRKERVASSATALLEKHKKNLPKESKRSSAKRQSKIRHSKRRLKPSEGIKKMV